MFCCRSQMAKNNECVNETTTRILATRVDAEDLIDRMLQETVISDNGYEDRSTDRGTISSSSIITIQLQIGTGCFI